MPYTDAKMQAGAQARSNKRRRERNGKIVQEFKDVPCKICGIAYPHYVMDLDHVRGEKKSRVSLLYNASVKRLEGELTKCDVLCSNCHRERTFGPIHSASK